MVAANADNEGIVTTFLKFPLRYKIRATPKITKVAVTIMFTIIPSIMNNNIEFLLSGSEMTLLNTSANGTIAKARNV